MNSLSMKVNEKLELISSTLKNHGFDHFGFCSIEPLSIQYYKQWLDAGMHANMDYLKTHLPIKQNPKLLMQNAQGAIVVTCSYLPHPKPLNATSLRHALYARGEDYHYWLKEKLNNVCEELKSKFDHESFLAFTDSGPVLERDLAKKAGLGWVGKNTCLIHPKKGSLFFIGEIITSIKFEDSPTSMDHCGTCTRCIDICPTGALDYKVLNANKCISYWTIESKTAAPEPLRSQIGDWYFGCDLCQTVCPWNNKELKKHLLDDLPNPEKIKEDLKEILCSTNNSIQRKFKKTPLSRASPKKHKQNALVLIGNLKLKELLPEVEHYLTQSEFQELAKWVLTRLKD